MFLLIIIVLLVNPTKVKKICNHFSMLQDLHGNVYAIILTAVLPDISRISAIAVHRLISFMKAKMELQEIFAKDKKEAQSLRGFGLQINQNYRLMK